jgi:hypothetical protein
MFLRMTGLLTTVKSSMRHFTAPLESVTISRENAPGHFGMKKEMKFAPNVMVSALSNMATLQVPQTGARLWLARYVVKMTEQEYCVYCGVESIEDGVIYVREQKDGKWDSYPCCTPCWFDRNPTRKPTRFYKDGVP